MTRTYTVSTSARARRQRWTNKREAIRAARRLAKRVMPQTVSVYYHPGGFLAYQCHATHGVGARARIVVEEL